MKKLCAALTAILIPIVFVYVWDINGEVAYFITVGSVMAASLFIMFRKIDARNIL